MRSEQDVIRAMEQYADTVRRLCMIHLKSYHDLSSVKFENEEHEKAWFIRVTINACRDFFKDFFRSHMVPLEELIHQQEELTPDNSEVLEAVLSLPEKYREAVYLYYYEGYTAVEIAHILKKNKNTVYTLLTRSKQLLRERLGGDDCET